MRASPSCLTIACRFFTAQILCSLTCILRPRETIVSYLQNMTFKLLPKNQGENSHDQQKSHPALPSAGVRLSDKTTPCFTSLLCTKADDHIFQLLLVASCDVLNPAEDWKNTPEERFDKRKPRILLVLSLT